MMNKRIHNKGYVKGGQRSMYVGRDMTELSMIPKQQWKDSELAFFHKSLQQMAPYLNIEGVTIHNQIIKELEERGGLNQENADWTHGTTIQYD